MREPEVFFTRTSVWIISALSILILGFIDYATGWEFQFFVFYFVPISIVAWLLGMRPAMGMALLSAVVWHLADRVAGHNYSSIVFAYWNALIRLFAFSLLAFAIARIRALLLIERSISTELRQALAEVKTLSGLIPICAGCKKIRNDKGFWQQVEEYIEKHTDAEFTHGLCPKCASDMLKEAGIDPSSVDIGADPSRG